MAVVAIATRGLQKSLRERGGGGLGQWREEVTKDVKS